jgi:hypothetical protein
LKYACGIRQSCVPIPLEDQAVHLFHTEREGVDWHNALAHFPQEEPAFFFVKAPKVFEVVGVSLQRGSDRRRQVTTTLDVHVGGTEKIVRK